MSDSFVTPWTLQAPLSMRLPRQEPWSGLPFPSPGDRPAMGSNSHFLLAGRLLTAEPPRRPVRALPWGINSVLRSPISTPAERQKAHVAGQVWGSGSRAHWPWTEGHAVSTSVVQPAAQRNGPNLGGPLGSVTNCKVCFSFTNMSIVYYSWE